MSESPILEYWPEGIAAARIPANNNVRLLQALKINPAISATTAAQPGSPTEGDVYILPASPTGAQWASFFEGDVVIFYNATWTAYTPVDGLRKFVQNEGEDWQFVGDSSGGWAPAGGGGGAVDSVNGQTGVVVLDLGDLNDVNAPTPTDQDVLTWDSATSRWIAQAGGGGGGTPAGSSTWVQYNNAGAFGAEAQFAYDATTNTLTVDNITLVAKINEARGSNIASAATTDIGAATGNFVHVTGTTSITALGTVQAGTRRIVVFDGVLILTHNATTLILPTGANITTAAGDSAEFVSEGSGNWKCTGYLRATGAALVGGGSLTNWTEAVNSTSPNVTVPVVSFTVANAATDVDVVIASKGAGGLAREVADSTSAGGNKRGADAVDLQSVRSNAAMVASGSRAAIPGGFNNTASAQAAFAMGQSCTASGQQAFAMGESNTASGTNSLAIGGSSGAASATDAVAIAGATANAVGAICMGKGATNNLVTGAFAECYNSLAPRSRYSLYGQTTNATPLTLTTTTGAAAATNQVYFGNLNNRSGIYRGLVVARQTGNSGAKMSWEFIAHLDRDNGTLALVGAVTPVVIASSAGPPAWTVAVTANDTLKTLRVEVTGAAATTINWACFVDGQECLGT